MKKTLLALTAVISLISSFAIAEEAKTDDKAVQHEEHKDGEAK